MSERDLETSTVRRSRNTGAVKSLKGVCSVCMILRNKLRSVCVCVCVCVCARARARANE